MVLDETYELANGVSIPKLGLGTWFIDDGDAAEAVRNAVALGYRGIDTAQAYGNERGVGEGVRTCGLVREQLFVTSKVAAEHKSYAEAARSIDDTLALMQLDYLDLMIVHSPQPWAQWRGQERYFSENRDVWRALEDAYDAGKLRAIGVSNFLVDDVENLLEGCRIQPLVNQILVHVGNTPSALIAFCHAHGLRVMSYSPIAHGRALASAQIGDMARGYGVTPAQLCIRYVLQLGTVALPKSGSAVHMAENAAVDFEIAPEDMQTLSRIEFADYGEFDVFPVFSGKQQA